jgi:Protein of unknown function (DUF2752)
MTRRLTSRPGFTAVVLGTALLAQLALIGILFTADQDFAYFLGRRINYVCASRQRYGVPCPTCGLTRGAILTVHGNVRDAWRLSPNGPLAVLGIFAMGSMLLLYAALEQRRKPRQLGWLRRSVQAGAVAYVCAATLIWAGSWLTTVLRIKGHP